MKCVLKETEEFECFYLTKNSINDFIKWLNKVSGLNYKVTNYKFTGSFVTLQIDGDYYEYKYELNKRYVWKNYTLYDYDEDVFNQIYRRI